jgi:hypothetical protein
MYRSVIVPLDGSAVSEHVLPSAAQVARIQTRHSAWYAYQNQKLPAR